MNPTSDTTGFASSFKLLSGKAPILLQIIAGLLYLSAIAMIIGGIPLLFMYGLGLLPIILGILTIRYSHAIFRMDHKGYIGTLVIQLIMLLVALLTWASLFVFPSSMWAYAQSTVSTSNRLISIIFPIIVTASLYYYRNRFSKNNS